MSSLTSHKIYRDADAPWWELRVSTNSSDCYRQHTHDEYSLGIVDAGSSTFQHPGGAALITEGSVVMIEPHTVHSCNPMLAQRWSYRMLFIGADWLHENMARQWGMQVPPHALEFLARCIDHSRVSAAVDQLISVSSDMSTRLAGELPIFLSDWVRPVAHQSKATFPAELAPAELLLESNDGWSLSVADLANACGMTSTRFIREFKRLHGITPGDYLQDRRVNGARRLISLGVPLIEAALEMGFSDQAHLQRSFKARHAMTPGHYRQRPQQGRSS